MSYNFEILEDGASIFQKAHFAKRSGVKKTTPQGQEEFSYLVTCVDTMLENEKIFEEAEEKKQKVTKYISTFAKANISMDKTTLVNTKGIFTTDMNKFSPENHFGKEGSEWRLCPNTDCEISTFFLSAKEIDDSSYNIPFYHPSADWSSEDCGYGYFEKIEQEKWLDLETNNGIKMMSAVLQYSSDTNDAERGYYKLKIIRNQDFIQRPTPDSKLIPANRKINIFLYSSARLSFKLGENDWFPYDSPYENGRVMPYGKFADFIEKNGGYYYKIEIFRGYRHLMKDMDWSLTEMQDQFSLLFRQEENEANTGDFPFSVCLECPENIWYEEKNKKEFTYSTKTISWIRNGVRTVVLEKTPGQDYYGAAILVFGEKEVEATVDIKKGYRLVQVITENIQSSSKLTYTISYTDPWNPPEEEEGVDRLDSGTEFFSLACEYNSNQVSLKEVSPLEADKVDAQLWYLSSNKEVKTAEVKVTLKLGGTSITFNNNTKPTDIKDVAWLNVSLNRAEL